MRSWSWTSGSPEAAATPPYIYINMVEVAHVPNMVEVAHVPGFKFLGVHINDSPPEHQIPTSSPCPLPGAAGAPEPGPPGAETASCPKLLPIMPFLLYMPCLQCHLQSSTQWLNPGPKTLVLVQDGFWWSIVLRLGLNILYFLYLTM